MKQELVNLGHNDLDQLGCMLNIEYALPQFDKTYFHTNYKNIYDVVAEVTDYINKHDVGILLITDVSFAQFKHHLMSLVETCKANNTKIVYLDHHIADDNFFDEFENTDLTVVYNTSKSATKIVHDFFGNNGKDPKLDMLTRLIDVFDIWQDREPEFKTALSLNDYLWESILEDGRDLQYLMETIVSRGYMLPENYSQKVNTRVAKAEQALIKFKEKGLIHTDGYTTIAFVDDYFNDILYKEFIEENREVVIIANSYGIVRIRFNTFGTLTKNEKTALKIAIIGDPNIGHLNAFSLKIEHNSFSNIMAEIKRISGIIEAYKKKD